MADPLPLFYLAMYCNPPSSYMNRLRHGVLPAVLSAAVLTSILAGLSAGILCARPSTNQDLAEWLRIRVSGAPGETVERAIDTILASPVREPGEGILEFARALIQVNPRAAAELAGTRVTTPEALAKAISDLSDRAIGDAMIPRHFLTAAAQARMVSGAERPVSMARASVAAFAAGLLEQSILATPTRVFHPLLRLVSSARPLGP